MDEQTVVAVYDTAARAEAAILDLKAAHVPTDAIGQHDKNSYLKHGSPSGTTASGRVPGFWESLFGTDSGYDTSAYDRSIENGGTVVTVRVPDEYADRVSAILERHGPIELDEQNTGHASAASTASSTPLVGLATPAMPLTPPASGVASEKVSAASMNARSGDTIQLVEETLSVGKRAISGGMTRIHRYVVETPVEEHVNLHSEKVVVERRPVTDGRPITNADFTDKTIEMTETSEEAVVSKTARVREEISLRKEVSDHVETVKDTVRRDEVKVEQVPGQATTVTHSKETAPKPTVPPKV